MTGKFTVAGLVILAFLTGCGEEVQPVETHTSEVTPESKSVLPAIVEASGIADSKANPGYLWVHEDGGSPARLYLLSHSGKTAKTVFLKGATNLDWEDMLLAGNDLYIADIGDNANTYQTRTIYKFPEPGAATDTVSRFEAIHFKYADGARDAEAFLVDPISKSIYIITKRDIPSRIYKIAYPYSLKTVNTAELVGNIGYSGVVSAAMSADGKGIILKTYTSLYYYTKSGTEPVEQTLQKKYSTLPYVIEPQGEAVTFSGNSTGYFTLSEKAFASELKLNFYRIR